MQRNRTMKIFTHICLLFILLFFSAVPGYAAELTQRDWMVTLVDALGWSYGLPDEPQDPDYINILSGNREFRFETEDIYAEGEDNVALMSFQNFGSFGGRGWLNGTREPTTVHLRFTLPIGGEYQLQANLRQAGHKFSVGGAVKEVDAKLEFTKVKVGTFPLQAGVQEIVVILPPNGAIDYITLTAPNQAVIAPNEGWQPEAPLSWETIQTTLLQLFALADLFPVDPSPLVFEAEALVQTEVKTVSIPHLGLPSGGKWLRSGPQSTRVRFPVKLTESGFYDLSVRVMGNPINISIGGHQGINLEAKSYLDNYTFKSLFFFSGDSNITLTLPPGGGVDQLTLTGRQLDATLTSTLLGLEQRDNPGTRDLDTLSSLLAAFGVER